MKDIDVDTVNLMEKSERNLEMTMEPEKVWRMKIKVAAFLRGQDIRIQILNTYEVLKDECYDN